MRFIDADELIVECEQYRVVTIPNDPEYYDELSLEIEPYVRVKDIKKFPEAKVKQEIHAFWIDGYCSSCGRMSENQSKYCQHCGAKME